MTLKKTQAKLIDQQYSLSLPGLAVQRVDRKLGIHVWAKPSTRPPCVHCTSETVRIKATHSRTLKHTRQGNQIIILHLSIPKYHCLSCNRYFRHQLPLARPRLRARQYLSRLPGRELVQIVVMDLSETYRNIVQKYFPNAKIVADRFHVIRLVNQHFLNLWKQQDPVGRMNRGLLSLMRRHQWNLSQEQRDNLANYLEPFPVLKTL